MHRRCFEHIGVEVQYTEEQISHGGWIDRTIDRRLQGLEAIGFVDIDCLAYSKASVTAAYEYVRKAGSFIGLAQSANHLPSASAIYAAPAFLIISRRAFEVLGKPSLQETPEADVAQELSRIADERRFAYRTLSPIGFHQVHSSGLWPLGSQGFYGLGTEYDGGFFHNFNSRSGGVTLLAEKADAILRGQAQPTIAPFMSKALDLPGVGLSVSFPETMAYRVTRLRQKISRAIPRPVRRLKRAVLRQQ